MTKREAAERNVETNGDERKSGIICTTVCPFAEVCTARDGWDSYKTAFERRNDCFVFCKQWLADNPVDNGWEELKASEYEMKWIGEDMNTFRYRPRQSNKKETSHNDELIKYIEKIEKSSVFTEYEAIGLLNDLKDAVLYILITSAYIPPETKP